MSNTQQRWNYNETQTFQKSLEDLSLNNKDEFLVFLKSWAEGFPRITNNRTTLYFAGKKSEIWIAGLGNPEANKGKSGGFRLVLFLNIPEGQIFMWRIEHRNDKGFRGEKPREKQKSMIELENLKRLLIQKFEGA